VTKRSLPGSQFQMVVADLAQVAQQKEQIAEIGHGQHDDHRPQQTANRGLRILLVVESNDGNQACAEDQTPADADPAVAPFAFGRMTKRSWRSCQ
jgi:hypothetical protein